MEKLYLKELIEKLKLRLDSYSFNELKAIILEYAERLPPILKRGNFPALLWIGWEP